MRILENLFGNHVDRLQRSLTLASARHSVLSRNLANVNTPGYKRQDLDFNLKLGEELERQRDSGPPAIQTTGGSLRLDGNSVDLEQEVVAIAETELRYRAVSDMAASYFAGLKNVIREGR